MKKRSEDEGGEVGISVNILADLKDARGIQVAVPRFGLRPCGLVVRNCLIAIAVILLSPLFVGIGLLIKLNDGGPILHIARRMGRHGKPSASSSSAPWWWVRRPLDRESRELRTHE